MMWNQEPKPEDIKKQREHLKELREERNWTKSKVYKAVEATAKTYDKWEVSEKANQPTTAYLIGLSDLYGVSIDYILGRTDDRNYGNTELSKATGLSEKSIEVLRFLNSDIEDKEDEANHKKVIDFINLVLESSYKDVITYRKEETELHKILESRYPDIYIDNTKQIDTREENTPYNIKDDPSPKPIKNIFTTLYQYIDPRETELSFLDGGKRITVSGQAATLDSNGETTIYTVNELKRTTLLEQIKADLRALLKEVK